MRVHESKIYKQIVNAGVSGVGNFLRARESEASKSTYLRGRVIDTMWKNGSYYVSKKKERQKELHVREKPFLL